MGQNPGETVRILGGKDLGLGGDGMKILFKKKINMRCAWITYGLHLGDTHDPSKGPPQRRMRSPEQGTSLPFQPIFIILAEHSSGKGSHHIHCNGIA